jgi:hypothetical protein
VEGLERRIEGVTTKLAQLAQNRGSDIGESMP